MLYRENRPWLVCHLPQLRLLAVEARLELETPRSENSEIFTSYRLVTEKWRGGFLFLACNIIIIDTSRFLLTSSRYWPQAFRDVLTEIDCTAAQKGSRCM
ncbi:hypothetical protein PoB_006518500 [Plakobranchus ocellatus]|uniref:Uncharacterized protein n=1 Tax=Plakobranchus ocellatus TaxID=259542 RepID=A0AAV4D3G5_9GAST|nr:hypothetical protein PoB_006518500 [Plakobranchus ocellatus]